MNKLTEKSNKLSDKEQQIANLIYEKLDYMYCDNCRFNKEISREEAEKTYGYFGCEKCHRKYNGWGIAKKTSEYLATNISKILNLI